MDLDAPEDLQTLAYLGACDLRERELAVRHKQVWTPRLISIRERSPLVPADEETTYRLTLDNPGQIGGLQMKTYQPASLGPHDVEIDVAAAALNFRDVMVTLGLLPALFYASTMAVFPQYFFAFAREFKHCGIDHQMQPDLASMKKTFPLGLLGYPCSKLTSEQVLLFAQQAGMPLAIFRLPQTAVSTTGYIQPNDLTMQILAAVLDCESMPEGFTFRSNHEAVDTLSQACTAISLNPKRRFTIYHCCKPQLDYYDLELADFGVYFPEIPYESFKRACQARGENSPLHGRWAVLDHFGKYWFSEEKPDDRLPICDRAFREDCPHPIKWAGVLTKLRRSYQLGQDNRQHWPYPASHGCLDFDRLIARAEHYAEDYNVSFEQTYPT